MDLLQEICRLAEIPTIQAFPNSEIYNLFCTGTYPHDLEGYFESLAEQGFQNNFFPVLARRNEG